jgi:hypothetical protein
MKYINTVTRMIIDTESVISGGNWQPLGAAAPLKKAEPKPEPVKEEAPETEEVKEEPKEKKTTAKAPAKNTVKPRKR